MTNTQPVTEPLVPLWDDNAIIAAYQRAFDRYPDVHHMALMCWIRDDMQAKLARLEQQLERAKKWLPDSVLERREDDDE